MRNVRILGICASKAALRDEFIVGAGAATADEIEVPITTAYNADFLCRFSQYYELFDT